MELKHVRTFVAVAETGTVTIAAERLFMAQPAVTRQLQALERELGVSLFERKKQRLLLTFAGETFLAEARQLLNQAARVTSVMEEVRTGATGVIRVAAGPVPMHAVVLPATARFRLALPRVKIQLTEASGGTAMSLLDHGEVDLAVCPPPPRGSRVRWAPLYRPRLYALVSPTHPLSQRRFLTVRELSDEDVLLVRTNLIDQLPNLFPKGGDPQFKSIFESELTETVLRAAEMGIGVAITTDSISCHGYDLKALPLLNSGRHFSLHMGVARDENATTTQAVGEFVRLLMESAGRLPTEGYTPWEQDSVRSEGGKADT
jgi:DNA-binding transcriptional LysR family regulator